jgi:RNA polymerase sigma-70 factor (ECF subfamily)
MVASRREMDNRATPVSEADPRAHDLESWMADYGPGLRRFFARRVNESDVDDLVQDVFVRMQTSQSTSPIENAERYLFRVAQNVLISRYRADGSRERHLHMPIHEEIDPGDELSPERIAIGRDEYARIVQAITDLPPRVRAAFVFHRFENMTYQAIAARMGITKNSVKELIHRALVRLSETMEDLS